MIPITHKNFTSNKQINYCYNVMAHGPVEFFLPLDLNTLAFSAL